MSAIVADLTRVTSSEERTGVLSLFMAIRQFGLIFGKNSETRNPKDMCMKKMSV